MRNQAVLCLGLAALVWMPAPKARAADCGQLRMLNSVQMTRASDGRNLVPLRVNGNDEQFMLDTGGETTQITREAAEKIHLRIQPTHVGMVNVAGQMVADRAFVDDLEVGKLRGKDLKFPIAPFKNIDGILSLNFMLPYDIDIDFGTDKLNFFSQDHCPGGVLYWKADAVVAVPFVLEDGHIVVTLMIDGQQTNAVIDTGAVRTVMRMDVARQTFQLQPGDEATPEVGKVPDDDYKTPRRYAHNFKTVALGPIEVHNARVEIFKDPFLAGIVVGMDVLRKLHVYFAFAERKMYVSAASSAPVPADKN
jgi:predicted aspartyl protease